MRTPFQHTKKSSFEQWELSIFTTIVQSSGSPIHTVSPPALLYEERSCTKTHFDQFSPCFVQQAEHTPLLQGKYRSSSATRTLHTGTRNWPQNSRWLGLLYPLIPFIPVTPCVHLETSLVFSSLGTGIHTHRIIEPFRLERPLNLTLQTPSCGHVFQTPPGMVSPPLP